jgi:GTP-binding protein
VPRVAIVGRPNVGKSTLLNKLIGERRVIVSASPGTTRDPIDVDVELEGRRYRLIDTAGIRRKPQISEDADFYAVIRAKEALADADVAILMVDATEGVTHQDQRIAREVVDAGVGLVIVLNKWDALDEEQRELTERSLPDRFGFVGWAPVLRMAAKTGARMQRLPAAIEAVIGARVTRLSTGELNRAVRQWTAAHPPPVRKGRRPKIHYVVQAGTAPPTFVVFLSGGTLGDDYLRFLENRLREEADFTGNPLHIVARARERR